MVHELKILPEYFVAVRDGIKKFEVRKDDRPFEVGDILCLHEINCGVLTGRTIKAEVTYVLRHPDYCKEGYCILSIKVAQQQIVKQVDMPSTDVQPVKHKMIKDEICRMCLEYSTDMTCEHIRECKLMKVLDENKRLKEKVRKLEYEKSWRDSPERMGR